MANDFEKNGNRETNNLLCSTKYPSPGWALVGAWGVLAQREGGLDLCVGYVPRALLNKGRARREVEGAGGGALRNFAVYQARFCWGAWGTWGDF